MKNIVLGIRKIGPGLKAYLKFQGFANGGENHSVRLTVPDDAKMLAALSAMPLDIELFQMIMAATSHCRGNTTDRICNSWVSAQANTASTEEVINAYATINKYKYYYSGEDYGKVLSKRITNIVKSKSSMAKLDKESRLEAIRNLTNMDDADCNAKEMLEYIIENTIDMDATDIQDHIENLVTRWDDREDFDDAKESVRLKRAVISNIKHAFTLATKITNAQATCIIRSALNNWPSYCETVSTENGLLVTYKKIERKKREPKEVPAEIKVEVKDNPVSAVTKTELIASIHEHI